MRKHFFFSRTFLGALLGAGAHVLSDPKNPTTWMESAGVVWAAYGARSAIAKSAEGKV